VNRAPPRPAYPAPTIVVGLGRLGLALLERLAEDWRWLTTCGDDPSLKNLRLVHLAPEDDGSDPRWRRQETLSVDVARYAGDGDLPTRALTFAVLRSLGLVRYYDGCYQVAVPRDSGLVELSGAATEDGQRHPARRRHFEWWDLSPDPLVSAERLRELADQSSELDLFLTPIVNRVRQGHSPVTLMCCVVRCWRLATGRDPSPWSWLGGAFDGATKDEAGLRLACSAASPWLPGSTDERGHLVDHLRAHAPEPLPGWSTWWPEQDGEPPRLTVPAPFVPESDDLPSPLDPTHLLRVDWESSGWATHADGSPEVFTPAPATAFRLGLFDHDGQADLREGFQERLAGRLGELAVQVHRGLVRLWVDLQRDATRLGPEANEGRRRHHHVGDAVRQSLEVLGELLIRPLAEAGDAGPSAGSHTLEPRRDPWVDGPPMGEEPSRFIRSLVLGRRGAASASERALESRLDDLGLADERVLQELTRPLLREVRLAPGDVDASGGPDDGPSGGLLDFREALNEEARHLLDFSFLTGYRQAPVRTPPRLTVYAVGDMHEPFVRATMRTTLREVHAELQRAFGPIFDTFREGFDRSLAVVPILWMPHPADAFGGRHPVENRCEEAAIIDAVHGVRRWVETIPAGTRCISQVFVNSRVTDNATLGVDDAVRQTRDFLSFQSRNDLAREHWLRETSVGPRGADFFSSFSCHEVHFPAERAREYLANRLARACLRQLELGTEHGPDGPNPAERAGVRRLVEEAVDVVRDRPGKGKGTDAAIAGEIDGAAGDLRGRTERAAAALAEEAEGRLAISAATTPDEVEEAFDGPFGDALVHRIQDRWHELAEQRGAMDEGVDALRRKASGLLEQARQRVRGLGDRLVVEHASKGGLHLVQSGLTEIEGGARQRLQRCETGRRERQEACRNNGIPSAEPPVHGAREAVVQAAVEKPDLKPVRLGLVAWGLMAPAMGAPIGYALARALDLHLAPNLLELLLGPLAPLTIGALLFLPGWWLLRRHMAKAVTALREAVTELAATAARIMDSAAPEADASGNEPCVRSFFETRLRLAGALSARAHALRVHEQVVSDNRLAFRLKRSVEVQRHALRRRAEELGVRPAAREDEGPSDDVEGLFSGRWGDRGVGLVHPDRLLEYYGQRYAQPRDLAQEAEVFAESVGGFSSWRQVACLSETDALLGFCRQRFDGLVEEAVGSLPSFEREVGRRLTEFVARHYANIGFPAKFVGYEGLDPDEIHVLADAALVVDGVLARAFDAARKEPGAPPTTETMAVIESDVLPNSAWMLSLAQGIRARSIRNLGRFESYLDRAQVPEIIHFPTAGAPEGGTAPLNQLSGHRWLGYRLRDALRGLVRDPGAHG